MRIGSRLMSMRIAPNVRNRWHAQTRRDAGLPHIRLHDLRHTAAALAVAAGESVLFVQSMLGHSDVRTTMRYVHPDHEAEGEAKLREGSRVRPRLPFLRRG